MVGSCVILKGKKRNSYWRGKRETHSSSPLYFPSLLFIFSPNICLFLLLNLSFGSWELIYCLHLYLWCQGEQMASFLKCSIGVFCLGVDYLVCSCKSLFRCSGVLNDGVWWAIDSFQSGGPVGGFWKELNRWVCEWICIDGREEGSFSSIFFFFVEFYMKLN